MNVEVLFINPSNQKKTYQDLSKEFTAIATPVWTCLLANFVRNRGFKTAIYDVNVYGWDENTASQIIQQYNPNLIVMMVYGHQPSASTQTMPAARKIALDLKGYNKDIPLAMGGTHPSALPERTLQEEPVDFIIQGEGVYTIEGLAEFSRGKRDLDTIKGLWYQKKNLIQHTDLPSLVLNLDEELANYAWDLLPDIKNYRAHNMHCFQDFEKSKKADFSDVRTPYITLNTSLGCPYSCNYCCINATFGKPGIRYWSLDKVLTWIDLIVTKFKVRNIRFDDELFILSPKRVERFCDLIIERGYDLNIWVYGRVDTIRQDLLKKIKRAGINWICLGIESANPEVRASVNKHINKDIKQVVNSIQMHDIYVLGNFMFGLPEDTITSMEQTLQLAQELNCEFINFYTAMAYPGSQLFQWAENKPGYLPESWEGFSQHSYETQPLPTKYISTREVLKFRDDAFIKYNQNPFYLNMMQNKFGVKVKTHIEKMLSLKLKRKILED